MDFGWIVSAKELIVEFRDGVEVERKGGKIVFGWLAVGIDWQFVVGRKTLVDEVLPRVVEVLDVWGHVVWGMLEE